MMLEVPPTTDCMVEGAKTHQKVGRLVAEAVLFTCLDIQESIP